MYEGNDGGGVGARGEGGVSLGRRCKRSRKERSGRGGRRA